MNPKITIIYLIATIELYIFNTLILGFDMSARKKYFEKSVVVSSTTIKLYSLDGNTWSSNKTELEAIQNRYEQQRQNFSEQIGGSSVISDDNEE